MFRRLLALVALVFYGSIDRVTGVLFDDLDYPADEDTLASPPPGPGAEQTPPPEDRGVIGRLLAS